MLLESIYLAYDVTWAANYEFTIIKLNYLPLSSSFKSLLNSFNKIRLSQSAHLSVGKTTL